jgi:DNA-binding MarR family transcriptional regulator
MKQYLKFLTSKSHISIPFDDTALTLLEEIAILIKDGESVTVGEAMEMFHIASPATIHRKIDDLLSFGYIRLYHKAGDRRTKYFELTGTSVKYFERVESMMLEAAK